MRAIRKVDVFGFPVWRITVDELCVLILDWMASGEGHWVATLNLDYISRCRRDPEFHSLLMRADVFTADGMPILWASRQLDPSFAGMDRTTGADLTPKLILSAKPSDVAIVGGVDPKAAIAKLERNASDFFVFDGKVEVNETWAKDLAEEIGDRRLVLVALGSPKQEQLIDLLRRHLPRAVFVAVGGSFEMIAGIRRRAPNWMQRSGLEWIHRLSIEPGRLWKRYLIEYPPGAVALYRTVRAAKRTVSNKLPPS